MIRALIRTAEGKIQTDISPDDYARMIQNPDIVLWVDIFSEPRVTTESILRETFQFHPLAIDDALEETHVPKVDDWGDYLYFVVRTPAKKENLDQETKTEEVDIFLGRNFIVTYHEQAFAFLDRIWKHYRLDEKLLLRGTAQILYNLIDEIATEYVYLAEQIDEAVDTIEDQLFNNPQPTLLENIFALKRSLLHLRRMIAPQREVVNKLARGDYTLIPNEAKVYFRDVYDHFLRLYEILENLRDLTGSTLEIYLSVVNNRMNNVMRILTIFTTLFMPISFLAGFFGMNFFSPGSNLDVWTGATAFWWLIIAMILFPIGMYWWIRRRGWMK